MNKLSFFLFSIAVIAIVQSKEPLHIGILLPLSTGFLSDAGNTFLSFTEMAIRDINKRDDILADYELHYTILDTKVTKMSFI